MSSEGGFKRRCIKKLDFENCIVTSFGRKGRRRRQLRARLTREVEYFDSESPEPASPELIRKQPRRSESPVLLNRTSTRSRHGGQKSQDNDTAESSPTSPVFKIIHKIPNVSFNSKTKRTPKIPGRDAFATDSSSSFQIEDSTEESSQTVEISSVGSSEVKAQSSSEPKTSFGEQAEECESASKFTKKRYKKNSLCGRLQKLLQKRASEQLLWQHQKPRNSGPALTQFSVTTVWNQDSSFLIKCRDEARSENIFLMVDSLWVPPVKRVKEGSILTLHPPWQTINLETPKTTVFVNIICLEVLEGTKEGNEEEERRQSSVPTSEFVSNQKLFIGSLFSSYASGLFY